MTLRCARKATQDLKERTLAGAIRSGTVARYSLRDIAILVGWQVGLVVALTTGIGWWAYIVLWWLPVYIFTFCADITRVMAEHASFEAESDADKGLRLVSFESNWLERQFFAPMGMNHHATHHLWPGIPYYHLAAAEAQLKSHHLAERITWRGSYLVFVFSSYSKSLAIWRTSRGSSGG